MTDTDQSYGYFLQKHTCILTGTQGMAKFQIKAKNNKFHRSIGKSQKLNK